MQKRLVVIVFFLVTVTAQAQLRVRSFNGYHENGGTILFGAVTAQYCAKTTITLENIGSNTISLSTIAVDGDDFLISGNLPEFLDPAANITVDVLFHPMSDGGKSGLLTIYSNDANHGQFNIHLSGTGAAGSIFCDLYDQSYSRMLTSAQAATVILLSKTILIGNSPAGTVIGDLSLPQATSATEFALVPGVGAENNDQFVIVGKELRTAGPVETIAMRVLTLRVQGVSGGLIQEDVFRVTFIPAPIANSAEECGNVVARFDYLINDLAFNSSGQLFGASSDGKILQSLDDGENWNIINSGVSTSLHDLMFKGTVGYVSTETGILKSDDDGATWFQLYLPSTHYFYDVVPFFIDGLNGFLATDQGEFFHTSNGGRTWDTALLHEGGFKRIWFWNSTSGIAIRSNGRFSKTTNGGITWTYLTDPSGLNIASPSDFWFVNDTDGFLVNGFKLFKTTNKGDTWTKVKDLDLPYERIVFINETTGFIYGQFPFFYRTTDGGTTWEVMDSLVDANLLISTVAFNTESNKLYLSLGYPSPFERAIALSDNLGTDLTIDRQFRGENFYRVEFFNENTGFLFGEYNNYKTADKGARWTKLDWGISVGSAHFFDEMNGWVTNSLSLYKTSDGGQTLEEMFTPDPDLGHRIGNLMVITPQFALAYSLNSVYRTLDGGQTWQFIEENPAHVQDMHFVSETIGYRVALFGHIEKTTNAGTTWNWIYEPDPGSASVFTALYFVNEDLGFKAGNSGVFSKTTDGGLTWTAISTGFHHDTMELYFRDSMNGYSLGTQGSIYETHDGGASWNLFSPAITDQYIFDFQFNGDNIYLSGGDGLIATFTEPPAPPTQPGYISGDEILCHGDLKRYVLADLPGGNYYSWTSTGTFYQIQNAEVAIAFPEVKDYSISVSQVSRCGISLPRTLQIRAVEAAIPEISGPLTIDGNGEGIRYDVSDPLPILYTWHAAPALAVESDNSTAVIDWSSTSTLGTISVISIDPQSGCRAHAKQEVTLDIQVGIEAEADSYISVYPNPGTGVFLIESKSLGTLRAEVHDLMGRVYLENNLAPEGKATLNLQAAPPGVYLLELHDQNNNRMIKRIIKK
jgi:photosystem II stability/assembly factor-like uncharacterized protein